MTPDRTLERIWCELTAAVAEVSAAVESELHRGAGLLGSEYAVLAAAGAPPRRQASMTELGDAARLSPSGVTRAVSRLVTGACARAAARAGPRLPGLRRCVATE